MQLGFIGTGEITLSIVTGLNSSGVTAHSIWLSPRNSAVANELANRFHGISVASSNQEVLDHSDTIVIAVRPRRWDRAAESPKPLYGKSIPAYNQKHRAGVVQWQNRRFPSFL